MVNINTRVVLTYDNGQTIDEVPDIFIILKRGKVICTYIRLKARDIYNIHKRESSQYRIQNMNVDKSIVKNLSDCDAGYIRYRAGVFDDSVPSSWTKPNSSPKFERLKMVINLFSARNILSGDDNGLSDPQALLYHMGRQAKSKAIRCSVDPNWSERLFFETYAVDGYLYPLVISLYDLDEGAVSSSFEYLGSSLVPVDTLLPNGVTPSDQINTIPNPDWYQLTHPNGTSQGKVCLSVQILFPSTNLPKLMTISTQKDIFKLKLYILGLRNLKSEGIFNIKNPFIKINLGSIKQGHSGGYADVLTSKSKTGGPDASFNNLIS